MISGYVSFIDEPNLFLGTEKMQKSDSIEILGTVFSPSSLSGVPDYFDRNKILSGYDLSHYQVPHCIRVFFYFCLICVYSSQFSILF